jgi:hypothetical protein
MKMNLFAFFPVLPNKHIQKIALIFVIACAFVACKNNNESPVNSSNLEDYYEFQGFNLTPYDINATIMLPDETANIGASTQPDVVHIESDFYWQINIGQNFHLYIEDYGDNTNLVKAHKEKLKKTSFYDIEYLVDEPDMVIYRVKLKVRGNQNASKRVGIAHEAYHVFAEKVVNGIHYELRSSDEGADKEIIELMAKSIKSFKGKNDK